MRRNRKKSIPFFVLLIIHTSLLIFTFYKKKDRKRLFILLLSGVGLAYVFEYIVLNLFHSYRYKPNILKNKDLDNIFGAILSQAIFVPFTAVFLTAFNIGWRGKFLFGLYFAMIEKIFIKLKLFQDNWWQTKFTVTLIPLFFFFNDLWYKHLKKGTPIFLFGSLFLSIMVNGVNLLFIMAVLRKFKFGFGRSHSWREHFIIAPIYSISLSLVTAFLVKKDRSWRAMAKAFIFSKMMDLLVMKTGVAKKSFKHLLINNGIHIMMIYLSTRFSKWIYDDLKTD